MENKLLTRALCLIFLAISLLGNGAKAQVVIIPEAQSEGIVMKQQVWSMVINNMSGAPMRGLLQLTLTDKIASRIVMEASSNYFEMPVGVRRISFHDLSPITYSLATLGFGNDLESNQPLPVGEYLICYKILSYDQHQVIATECVRINPEPLSPPQLVYPFDQSAIIESRPSFSWTPPAPVYMFNSLSYDVIVSPVFNNQSPEEAMQRNVPVMTTASQSNTLAFPASFTNLEKGRKFAWQVVARDAGRYGGKSEVWTFTIVPDSIRSIIENASFIKLNDAKNELILIHQGILKVDFVNNSKDSILKVEISDLSTSVKKPIRFTMDVKQGQNRLKKDLSKLEKFDEGHVYQISFTSNNQKYSFRFVPRYYF